MILTATLATTLTKYKSNNSDSCSNHDIGNKIGDGYYMYSDNDQDNDYNVIIGSSSERETLMCLREK